MKNNFIIIVAFSVGSAQTYVSLMSCTWTGGAGRIRGLDPSRLDKTQSRDLACCSCACAKYLTTQAKFRWNSTNVVNQFVCWSVVGFLDSTCYNCAYDNSLAAQAKFCGNFSNVRNQLIQPTAGTAARFFRRDWLTDCLIDLLYLMPSQPQKVISGALNLHMLYLKLITKVIQGRNASNLITSEGLFHCS